MSKLEMSDFPWLNVEEGFQWLRKVGILEWICPLRPSYSNGQFKTYTFTNILSNKFVRGFPASLKSSVITLIWGPDLTEGTAATQSKNLNEMGIIGPQGHRTKWQHSTVKGKVGIFTSMDSRVKATIRIMWLAQTYGVGSLVMVFLQVK